MAGGEIPFRLSENTTITNITFTASSYSTYIFEMRSVVKLIDLVLFLLFLLIAVVTPLLNAHKVVPLEYYPKLQLLGLNSWYVNGYDDYLVSEDPHFFIGILWNEVIVLLPLAIANLVAMLSEKSWFNTSCLIFGANCFGAMAAIMGELLGSGRASSKLMKIYSPFTGLAALAVVRGLIPSHRSSSISFGIPKRPVSNRKKRA